MTRFYYQPVHFCPVCGRPVYDVPPFAHDCYECLLWASSVVSASGGAL